MRKVRFLILMILSVLSLNSCLLATGAGAYYGNYCANNRSATVCGGR